MALGIYKPGQGRISRVSMGLLLAMWTAYGAHSLAGQLADVGGRIPVAGMTFTLAQVIPVVLFVVAMLALLWLLNWRRFADFLIETEIEMRKVDWPARRTVVMSSVVVIVTVIVMSLFLYGVDYVVYGLLKFIRLY